ncbi:hypothetical protein DL96DRAFT_1822471 [Flagelloscypha sp. PMI_526]|nr:hypothetical protein DL96DRAFT_1822471 [Flagelloscypha sp. PMI_526]
MSLPMSEDALTEIFHWVHDIDRQTIFSLSIVNNTVRSIALPFIYRECSFDLCSGVKPEDLQRLEKWLDRTGSLSWIPRAIRRFTLRGGQRGYGALGPETWAPFLELIPRMTRLSTFVFSIGHAQFPLTLLQALEGNIPHVCVAIHNWNLGDAKGTELDKHLDVFSRSPLLREIHLVNKAGFRDITFVAFRHLVSLAPNLRKVVVCAPHPEERRRGFCGNGKRAHAETLSRAEARFSLLRNGRRMPSLHEFHHLEVTHAPADFAEQCLRIVDPAHLEHLELELPIITNPNVINPLSFPALRHLALDVYDEQVHRIVTSFLQVQCMGTSLESFTLRTSYPIPETILPQLVDTHGPTLKTLVLRNDLQHRRYPNPVIPFSPIQQESICIIRDACPVLERLYLCVSRKSEAAVFDILAEFSSRLRHLTLDFGSGCSHIHVSATAAHQFYWWQEGVDIDMKLKLPSEDIEEWEQMLWLHTSLASPDIEEMFRKIYKGGNGASSLETLIVRIRHPWMSRSQQDFLVQRQSGGTSLKTSILGSKVSEGDEMVLEFDDKVPREERLKMMWTNLCPRKVFPIEKS